MSIVTQRNMPALSKEQQDLLGQKHVVIIGCRTTGSWVAECLVRAGIGRLTFADSEELAKEDGNRSIWVQPDTIGENAAFAGKGRTAQIDPDCRCDVVRAAFREATADTILSGKDLVISCLESIEDRLLLEDACEKADLPLFHCAVYGWQAEWMHASPKARSLHRFYAVNHPPKTHAELSASAAAAASMVSAEAIRFLAGCECLPTDRMRILDLACGTCSEVEPDEVFYPEHLIRVKVIEWAMGERYIEVPEDTPLTKALEGFPFPKMMVMVNDSFVHHSYYDSHLLEDGDVVMIRKVVGHIKADDR